MQSYRTGALQVAEVPAPGIEPGCLLVHTTASLVSVGTERMVMNLARKSLLGKARERPDLVKKVFDRVSRDGIVAAGRAVFDKLDQAIPLGYSCTGRVIAVGEGISGFAVGDRVACAGAKIANHAEVNLVPQNLAVRVPDPVSDEAAAFVTVGAVALQGIRVAQPTLGETFAVIGLGLIGQLAAQLLKANGCRVVGIDLDPAKVELAQRLGADLVLQRGADVCQTVEAFTSGRGVDGVLITAATASNDPVELSGAISRDRGRVVVVGAVGMEIPRRPYYDKELSFHQSRSYGPGRYDPVFEELGVDYPLGYVRWTEQRNMEAFLDQCAQHHIRTEALVSHRFAIADAEQAYRQISEDDSVLGVLLTYPHQEGSPARTVGAGARVGTVTELGASFIGAGGFATGTLIPAVAGLDGVRLISVASARGMSAQHAAQKFGFQRATTDFDSVLADPEVKVVFITTRHDLHASQVVAALDAGKHVFVEKPLALEPEGLAKLIAAAEASDRQLMVGFNRRFAPLSRELKSFIGKRKQPLIIQYRINAGPIPAASWIHDPAVGGGRILGEVCHFIDYVSFLTDSLPVRVFTQGVRPQGGVRADDNVVLSIALSDGSIASICYVATSDPSAGKERIEVLGNGAWAQLSDFRELRTRRGGKERVTRKLAQDKGHRHEVVAFLERIRRGGSPLLGLQELAAVTRASFAAQTSLETGLPVEVEC